MSDKLFELGRLTIVDLYDWHNRNILEYESYFQRQTAWREKDRIFLIDSIINNYPIPSIFICDAEINYDNLAKKYNVLDGRQRLESIFKFLKNDFQWEGKYFKDLTNKEKDQILNFSIPIIQIFLKPNDVEKIKEIFRRLNTNSRNLNKIEKEATRLLEYDFMILCKVLANIIKLDEFENYKKEIDELFKNDDDDVNEISISEEEKITINPEVNDIISNNDISFIQKLFLDKNLIFSEYEIGRQVHLQYLLNILGSIILNKIINRNLSEADIISISEAFLLYSVKEKTEEYNNVCRKLYSLLKKEELDKFWISKYNLYSLSYLFLKNEQIMNLSVSEITDKLNTFCKSEDFNDYRRFVQERGNDKVTREKRNNILEKIFTPGQNN